MTAQEFEKHYGVTLGKGLRKIYTKFVPNKYTPAAFWKLAQANNKVIEGIIGGGR